MKINDVKQACATQLNVLQAQRQALKKTLQENPRNFDRVGISRELSQLDAQYEAVRGGLEGITARETAIRGAEAARQQGEAMSEAYSGMTKMLEVYRRIASGGKVPPSDEQKLLDYSAELYMAAKNMAFMKEKSDKEYESLWDEEEETSESAEASAVSQDVSLDASAPPAPDVPEGSEST